MYGLTILCGNDPTATPAQISPSGGGGGGSPSGDCGSCSTAGVSTGGAGVGGTGVISTSPMGEVSVAPPSTLAGSGVLSPSPVGSGLPGEEILALGTTAPVEGSAGPDTASSGAAEGVQTNKPKSCFDLALFVAGPMGIVLLVLLLVAVLLAAKKSK